MCAGDPCLSQKIMLCLHGLIAARYSNFQLALTHTGLVAYSNHWQITDRHVSPHMLTGKSPFTMGHGECIKALVSAVKGAFARSVDPVHDIVQLLRLASNYLLLLQLRTMDEIKARIAACCGILSPGGPAPHHPAADALLMVSGSHPVRQLPLINR